MTTGDEEAEGLVDDLFRDGGEQVADLGQQHNQAGENLADLPDPPSQQAVAAAAQAESSSPSGALNAEVDDQFADLEREYTQAREDLAATGPARIDSPTNALEASTERFELQSQVASLQAEVSRQADELDERDRMLNELGNKVAGSEAQVAQHEAMADELHAARQETLEERREQARLSALLDARAAERQELADVANRLQHDRDHVQELLATALARHDEGEARVAQMDDKVRHLEAAIHTASHEHDLRAHELIESRAEMSKLADRLDGISATAAAAEEKAEKADALAERRANEAGYLNRRIAAMTEKLDTAGSFEDDANNVRRELAIAERRVTELERELATEQSEVAAAQAAVEAVAERTANYDELVAVNEQLSAENERIIQERDEAWKAASGPAPTAVVEPQAVSTPEPAGEVSALAERARELSNRRASEAAMAAEQAAEETAAARDADSAVDAVSPADVVSPADDELHDLDADDVDVIDTDLAQDDLSEPDIEVPAFEFTGQEAASEVVLPRVVDTSEPAAASVEPVEHEEAVLEPEPEPVSAFVASDQVDIPVIEVPSVATPSVEVPSVEVPSVQAAAVETPSLMPAFSEQRKRIVLPADLEPNTPEAVAHLLNQPGVTAIIDARSTCGRTGIRPSELFERVAALRDYFDVPVEVVVTPVSTPVGGAPDLPAIGVHHITGADTVADRIRALCMGFPADQPLVVIAGDDHVRRAAIGEEANVVEPAAVLNLTTS